MLDLLFFDFILQLLEVGKGTAYVHFSCSSFPTEAGEGEREKLEMCSARWYATIRRYNLGIRTKQGWTAGRRVELRTNKLVIVTLKIMRRIPTPALYFGGGE